jgi:hypothetical protein
MIALEADSSGFGRKVAAGDVFGVAQFVNGVADGLEPVAGVKRQTRAIMEKNGFSSNRRYRQQ